MDRRIRMGDVAARNRRSRVRSGKVSALRRRSRTRWRGSPGTIRRSMPSPPSPPSARAPGRARSMPPSRRQETAARRRAVRGEEPVRRRRVCRRVAGSKINRDVTPPPREAPLIERLEAAGAVLVGALNMGEYAYDFTGENVHDGPSRNPHDTDADDRRLVGRLGRRGRRRHGAARARLRHQWLDPGAVVAVRNFRAEADLWAADAARASFPFVASLDHLGPFARSTRDLALAYDAMQGPTPTTRPAPIAPVEPVAPLLDAGSMVCVSRSPAAISARALRRRR